MSTASWSLQSRSPRARLPKLSLKIIQVDQDLSSEVGKELREIDAKVGEFVERKIAAEDQLKRIDIRAPQDGTVFQLAVHTIGGVIKAGEPIMMIVPDTGKVETSWRSKRKLARKKSMRCKLVSALSCGSLRLTSARHPKSMVR